MLGLNVKQENSSPIVSFFLKRKSRNLFRNICCFSERKSTTEVLDPWNRWLRFVNALNEGLSSWRCLNTPLSIPCEFSLWISVFCTLKHHFLLFIYNITTWIPGLQVQLLSFFSVDPNLITPQFPGLEFYTWNLQMAIFPILIGHLKCKSTA